MSMNPEDEQLLGEVADPNVVPEVKAPLPESEIKTTPDTNAGRVRMHMNVQGVDGVGNLVIGLTPSKAILLAKNLHADAAFVNRYKRKGAKK